MQFEVTHVELFKKDGSSANPSSSEVNEIQRFLKRFNYEIRLCMLAHISEEHEDD